MHVIGYDPSLTVSNALEFSRDVKVVPSLDDLIKAAQIITVHVPLTRETENLIGPKQIEVMLDGVVLVNYARERIYDDHAVCMAIASGKVSTFISDFPTPELVSSPGVITTPHLGASTEESEENCAVMAVQQVKDFCEIGAVTNSVNFPTTYMASDRSVRTRLVVVNNDVPNMIAGITSALGSNGINIARNHNESNGVIGFNLIDLNEAVSDDILTKIGRMENVLRVRAIPMNRR